MTARRQGPGEDARFEDGAEAPLRLRAESVEDLGVISALLQDAVARIGDIAWTPRRRRLSLLVGRFRWEDAGDARRQGRPYERVRTLVSVGDALRVRAEGLDPREKETVVSLLAVEFEPDAEGAGRLRLVFAGDGVIEVEVEGLDLTLADVSQPYAAPSGKAPEHPD